MERKGKERKGKMGRYFTSKEGGGKTLCTSHSFVEISLSLSVCLSPYFCCVWVVVFVCISRVNLLCVSICGCVCIFMSEYMFVCLSQTIYFSFSFVLSSFLPFWQCWEGGERGKSEGRGGGF